MRIERRALSPKQSSRLREDLADAVVARCIEGRVCGQCCTLKCRQCGSTSCQCTCSPYCPDAATHLSSDPDNHPVERGIVPLVYELTRLGVFRPCWSCEGHIGPDGALWKLPRVWFYCDSLVHVRLLADVVGELKTLERLSAPWQVVVSFSNPHNPEATFSLEPVPLTGDAATLASLQADAVQISQSLKPLMSKHARLVQSQSAI